MANMIKIEFIKGPDVDRYVIKGTNILHRDDGPAAIFKAGHELWYQNGVKHRADGPAITWYTGKQAWIQNGVRHRLDGPAVVSALGPELDEYWINGIKHTEDSYKLLLFTLYNKKVND